MHSQMPQVVKRNMLANTTDVRDIDSIPGSGRFPGGGHATHSWSLAWKIPMDRGAWGLQFIGLHRVRHDWSDLECTHTHVHFGHGWLSGKESDCQWRRRGLNPWIRKIHWRRKWQPSPLFLPRKSYGQGSLSGYSPWGHKSQT